MKRDQQEMRARLADVQVSLDAINRRLDTVRTELTDKGGSRDSAAMRELQKRVADLEAHTATVAPAARRRRSRPPTRRGSHAEHPRARRPPTSPRARRSSAAQPRQRGISPRPAELSQRSGRSGHSAVPRISAQQFEVGPGPTTRSSGSARRTTARAATIAPSSS